MSGIARVVVDLSLDKEFDYAVPPELAPDIHVGSRVVVPFGKSKRTGYVVGFSESSTVKGLKPIHSVSGKTPLVAESVLELARWIADYYCAPVETAIRTVLPAAVRGRGARFKQRLFVTLCDAVAEGKLSPKQAIALDLLRGREGMFLKDLLAEAGISEAPVRALARKGLVNIEPETVRRDPMARRNVLPSPPLELMPEQRVALDIINQSVDRQAARNSRKSETDVAAVAKAVDAAGSAGGEVRHPGVVLLHGVTGSGKTEVYLQAIDHLLGQGGGAIVLVPEISLTPQTVERFAARFGARIAVMHSHLSDGERHDEWHRIRDGKADVVIGARSAVFAPVKNLGLIVVDEEHEPSYKQEDVPRYNARDVAVMRGAMEHCTVVLGSATPSLESWHNAHRGKYALARLTHRADHRKMPAMRIVDMRIETEKAGHVSVFSTDLLNAMKSRLERAEQTMLFLNRRGYATSLICPKCGHVANCDQCSVSYTYHKSANELRCHICGGSKKPPACCPGCSDPAFKFSGVGTQRVEKIVQKCFPHACVARMDTDTTTTRDAYERILGDFRVGKIDILVGTQMIAKGLHFPNVTLVGVIYADLSLHMPDFRAGERTFQLLAQVGGRAGRGEVPGEVIVQTYTPFHAAVQAARRLDYEGFCDQEMEFRRELSYPPFGHLVCLTLKGASEEKVAFCASSLAQQIGRRVEKKVFLSDVCPAPLARARGKYRYQMMLRCPSTRAITEPVTRTLREFTFPKGITCTVDVDALSLM
ncbi:MAG: primosomal protein N' [Lentisphaerae bacterium]|nr:primosomal protein N' [Lentisphaerota bacterium]